MNPNAIAVNWGPALLIALSVFVGLLYQTHHFDKRMDALQSELNRRIDDLKGEVSRRIDDLRDLLKSEVKRLEEGIEHAQDRVRRP